MHKFHDPYQSLDQWKNRQDTFSYLMNQALGNDYVGASSMHARLLEMELEKIYCAGAWYATIVFACAATEAYVAGQGEKREAKFLEQFGLRDDWIWLTNKRKYIVHPSQHSPSDLAQMLFEQPELEADATRAVGIALNVLLLGTRFKLPTSLEKTG